MKYKSTLILATLVILSGCTNLNMSKTGQGAVGGAALGSGLGAIIGHSVGKTGGGIAIGGGVGALLGGLLGNNMDKNDRRQADLDERSRRQEQEIRRQRKEIQELKGTVDQEPQPSSNHTYQAYKQEQSPDSVKASTVGRRVTKSEDFQLEEPTVIESVSKSAPIMPASKVPVTDMDHLAKPVEPQKWEVTEKPMPMVAPANSAPTQVVQPDKANDAFQLE